MKKFLSTQEIAELKGVTTPTINLYVSRPEFNKFKVGEGYAYYNFNKEMSDLLEPLLMRG